MEPLLRICSNLIKHFECQASKSEEGRFGQHKYSIQLKSTLYWSLLLCFCKSARNDQLINCHACHLVLFSRNSHRVIVKKQINRYDVCKSAHNGELSAICQLWRLKRLIVGVLL